jgi:hypothetical protein
VAPAGTGGIGFPQFGFPRLRPIGGRIDGLAMSKAYSGQLASAVTIVRRGAV